MPWIALDSGRDSSSLEYPGDYVLSLEYEEIDNGRVRKGTDSYNDDLSRLQQAEPRKMVMRVLKNRLGTAGKSCRLDFDACGGRFYPGSVTGQTTSAGKRKADMVK